MAGPTLASDLPEAQLTWRLQFGGQHAIATGYGLALSYRAGTLADTELRVAELDVSDRAALARLAGVPLFQRNYVASQDDAAPRPEFRVALSQPWYAKSWVWWTLGGLAATAALTSAAGGGGDGNEDVATDENTCVGPDASSTDDIDADCVGTL